LIIWENLKLVDFWKYSNRSNEQCGTQQRFDVMASDSEVYRGIELHQFLSGHNAYSHCRLQHICYTAMTGSIVR